MDHDRLVEHLLDRCTWCIEKILQASDLHSVAAAALALVAPLRQGARDLLQAKIDREAQQRQRTAVARCCQEARVTDVHTRTVSPQTLFGDVCLPGRTFPGEAWGASLRPADRPRGVPEAGHFTADVRVLYAPGVAARPPRVAHDLLPRYTGVALSSRGAQGLIASTAQALQRWQATREPQEASPVADAWRSADRAAAWRVEGARAGVMAHSDGRWQGATVATTLGRRREAQAEAPTRGAGLARRDVGLLGAADELAARLTPVLRQAGWEPLPIGAMRGDGAPWRWAGADAHGPGVRQTWDDSHRSAHLQAFATLPDPDNPAGAKARVAQKRGALLADRGGAVWGARKRMRPWHTAVRDALAQLIGDVPRNRTRIRGQEPWHSGLAVGSGAVEGACTPVMQSRFTRAGMRWQPTGCLHVLAWRLARLHGTFQAFWASRGLVIQTSG